MSHFEDRLYAIVDKIQLDAKLLSEEIDSDVFFGTDPDDPSVGMIIERGDLSESIDSSKCIVKAVLANISTLESTLTGCDIDYILYSHGPMKLVTGNWVECPDEEAELPLIRDALNTWEWNDELPQPSSSSSSQ